MNIQFFFLILWATSTLLHISVADTYTVLKFSVADTSATLQVSVADTQATLTCSVADTQATLLVSVAFLTTNTATTPLTGKLVSVSCTVPRHMFLLQHFSFQKIDHYTENHHSCTAKKTWSTACSWNSACSSQAAIQTPHVCICRFFGTVTVQRAQWLCIQAWLNQYCRKVLVTPQASLDLQHVNCRQLSMFFPQCYCSWLIPNLRKNPRWMWSIN